jgi:glycerophosphoryl diester phosphodiesterase
MQPIVTLLGILAAASNLLPGQAPDVASQLRRLAAERPLVVAHRGSSEEYPENTLAAFRAARREGADLIEFDLHQTRDGHFVALHDKTLDRTTDAVQRVGRKEVRVDALTLAEVRELDAGGWRGAQFAGERVPTLAETLEAIFPAVPMLEHKAGDAAALAKELQRLGAMDRLVVQSFDWDWLRAFRAAAPTAALGALGSKTLTAPALQTVAALEPLFVHWDHRSTTHADLAACRQRGWLHGVYTVDPDLVLVGAVAMGCDLVTTNRPARMVALWQQGMLPRPSAKPGARR